jgi:hypothetical protein
VRADREVCGVSVLTDMRILRLALVVFVLQLVALGQMDDNTLTVTTSRTINFQPDQVVFSVYADFEPTATLNDVLTSVQSLGITLANLSYVSTYGQSFGSVGNQTTEWSFILPVPFSKLSEELSALAALKQSVGKNPARSLNYSVQGTQVSQQLRASGGCPYGSLFQDAGVQARTLAATAGVMLGPIVAISDRTGAPPLTPTYYGVDVLSPVLVGVPYATFPAGGGLASSFRLPVSPQATCTIAVQFRLLH